MSAAPDSKRPENRTDDEVGLDDWLSDRPTVEVPPDQQGKTRDGPDIELRVEDLDWLLGGSHSGLTVTDPLQTPLVPPSPQPRDYTDPRSIVGDVVAGRYRIVGLVAQGGMGAVYQGEHLLLCAPVAIKLLGPEAKNLPELVERFRREALVGAHVRHPNIAAATDFGRQADGSYYLVLEFVDGTTLHQELEAGPFEPARAAHIAQQIAEALAALHARGVVHRDLKPSNVMLARRGALAQERDLVKLIDFGFAKLDRSLVSGRAGAEEQEHENRLTSAGVVFGTLAYLAPEAALGMDAVDERSDLYALGLVLYRMLAGRHPFTWEGDGELFRKQLQEPPPPLAEAAPDVTVPPKLEALVLRLLEKEPGRRFQSAAEVVRALGPFSKSEPPPAPVPSVPPPVSASPPPVSASPPPVSAPPPTAAVGPTTPMTSTRTPHNWPWLLGAAVAAGVALIVLWLRPSKPPAPSTRRGPEVAARASARPGASVLPSAPAPPPVSPPPFSEAEKKAIETRLVLLVNSGKWATAFETFAELVPRDPAFVASKPGRNATITLLNALCRTNDPRADGVLRLLAHEAGPPGFDVLLQISLYQGGSAAYPRATATLADPMALADSPPEIKAALDLYRAGCDANRDLYQQVSEQGDLRAVLVFLAHRDRCPKNDEREKAFYRLQRRLEGKSRQ